ncbi:hypothetical protein FA15DRAFT_716217 [Coprinopsis marcescibilis]|uniref:Uncharacterized protein n=1 Tax=Coprinopsis marcescibilis TaxID=230819 RepID=A0A5C3KN01_COPMA|nr:hypothetical protein FA15DRAFT_716217 [Coprinopsis marcescibilis]
MPLKITIHLLSPTYHTVNESYALLAKASTLRGIRSISVLEQNLEESAVAFFSSLPPSDSLTKLQPADRKEHGASPTTSAGLSRYYGQDKQRRHWPTMVCESTRYPGEFAGNLRCRPQEHLQNFQAGNDGIPFGNPYLLTARAPGRRRRIIGMPLLCSIIQLLNGFNFNQGSFKSQ